MRRVLIAGCGYVGVAAADLFHARDWEVEGWTSSEQSASELSGKQYPVAAVDLTDADAVAQRAGNRFDTVIHCASSRGGNAADYRRIYFDGAQNLCRAFADSVVLFTSSTSVYGQTSGEWVTERSAAEPTTESGRVLRETEEFVLNRGGIVARLAGIYGPGRSAMLRKFLAGEAVIDAEERFINKVHRDDIAKALLVLTQLAHDKSGAGEPPIYNVSDGEPLLQRECYQWLAAELNRAVPPTAAAPLQRKRGRSNKRVSNARLQALGWSPRYPTFASAMEESILPHLAECGA